MSRIGRAPIAVPAGVEFDYDAALVTVKGPKGELQQRVPREMIVENADGVITVKRPTGGAAASSSTSKITIGSPFMLFLLCY